MNVLRLFFIVSSHIPPVRMRWINMQQHTSILQ